MVHHKLKGYFGIIKRSKYLPILISVIILILVLVSFLSYEKIVEKEKLSLSHIFNENQNSEFQAIIDSNILNTDPNIIQKIDSDLRPLLNQNFGGVKFDRKLLIKSSNRSNYHFFYFSKFAPSASFFKVNLINNIEKLGYVKKSYDDERTFEYYLEHNNQRYLVIINLLSYNSDDSIGIYMIYVEKLI